MYGVRSGWQCVALVWMLTDRDLTIQCTQSYEPIGQGEPSLSCPFYQQQKEGSPAQKDSQQLHFACFVRVHSLGPLN